jgi:hypothetical protein
MMMKISWYYVHYFTFHCFSYLLFFCILFVHV